MQSRIKTQLELETKQKLGIQNESQNNSNSANQNQDYGQSQNTMGGGQGMIQSLILASIFINRESELYQQRAADIGGWKGARAFKVIRVIKYIPNRDHVYFGMIRALKSSGAVFLYLFLMVYVFSIIGHFMLSNSLPEHSGTPLDSMYTVFLCL